MSDFRDAVGRLSHDGRVNLEDRLLKDRQQGLDALGRPLGAGRAIRPRGTSDPCPLSFSQQRLWFESQIESGNRTYNIDRTHHITGRLDVDALKRALNAVVARHEALRTTFSLNGDSLMQVVHPPRPVPITQLDFSDRSRAESEAELHRTVLSESDAPFNLAEDLMLRAGLYRLAADEHVLQLVVHHIAGDGWSLYILLRDLSGLYREYSGGTPARLPELPIQYADYAVWQRAYWTPDSLEHQLQYWKQQLDGAADLLELPSDFPRPAVRSYNGATARSRLPPELFNAVRELSRGASATPYMTLVAAFNVLLSRYTGRSDLVIGTPIAGRTRVETENLVGLFVNTLALRTNVADEPTFREMLARVSKVTLGAINHQDLPFEKLVEVLHPVRGPGYHPLVEVFFALQNMPRAVLDLPGLQVSRVDVDRPRTLFDLTLIAQDEGDELSLRADYNKDLFRPATIERLLGHYRALLEAIVADPDRRVSGLPLLPGDERRRLLVDWNATQTSYPADRCIHELFEEQAERAPDAVALEFQDQSISYGELNARANQLAHELRTRGIAADALVGICLERSPDMVVGLLGILKAGGAYVPLDPTYPPKRLSYMLNDSGVQVLVTRRKYADQFAPQGLRIVCVDADSSQIAQRSQLNPDRTTTPDNMAYVNYTSGSTGEPKGVAVRHEGVVRLLFGVDYATLDADQSILHLSTISFDASTFEIWGVLLHGGRCVLMPAQLPSIPDLERVFQRHQVTTLWLTASLFNAIVDEHPEVLAGVRQLLTGGEALSVPHVRKALKALPGTQIINGYGPTECTTFTCCYRIPRNLPDNISSIPIGRPIGNTEVYVLDVRRQPVPIGVPGELYIGGAGLARGYLNDPELTSKKFIPHPFVNEPNQRLYKTGDRVRWLPDGTLEFLGRFDHQVKLRGYRLELGEIEAALKLHSRVRAAVVLLREDHPGDRRLVAYVVPEETPAPTAHELRGFLKQTLPDYMLPSLFVFVDQFPLTPTGKIDRRALPSPGAVKAEAAQPVPPRTPLEHELAAIFRDVLGVQRIGVHDNFFELGGHSLLIVPLMGRIEAKTGQRLSFASILEAPTVERLAERIGQNTGASQCTSLVAVRTNGSKPPLFWVHGDPGSAEMLKRYFDTDRPLFWLTAGGEAGQPAEHTSVEAIAAHYLSEAMTVAPEGPAILGGFSFGAVVAFEMAQQLQKQGKPVRLLFLVDPTPFKSDRHAGGRSADAGDSPGDNNSAAAALSWPRRHFHALAQLPPHGKWIYLSNRIIGWKRRMQRAVVHAIKKQACEVCLWLGRPVPMRLRIFYRNTLVFSRAMQHYAPQPYSGRMLLFASQIGKRVQALPWEQLAQGESTTYTIPCVKHLDFLEEGHFRNWCDQLSVQLQALDAAPADGQGPARSEAPGSA